MKADEDLYRTLINSADSAVICSDLQGRILSWNRGAQALFGFTADEMLGSSLAELYPPELRDQFQEEIEQVRAGDTIRLLPTRRLHKSGDLIPVLGSLAPVIEQQQITAVAHLLQEASHLLDKQRDLSLLAAIINSSENAIISTDLNGRVTSWNRAAEMILGYSAAEMLGQSLAKTFPVHRQQELNAILGEIKTDQHVDHIRSQQLTRSGNILEVEATLSPIWGYDGQTTGLSIMLHDIEKKLAAEEILSRYRAIVNSSEDAIVAKDLNGIVTSWNRGAEKLFGYSADEMIGKSLMKIIPDDRRHEEIQILKRIARGETVSHFETKRRRKNGDIIDISVSISPILVDGRVVGSSKVARDITYNVASREDLWRKANLDALTGLYNRHYFRSLLASLGHSRSTKWRRFAVFFIDLDHFKQVNDTYGHGFADKVLQVTGRRMRAALRSSDIVARIGGDEFVVIAANIANPGEVERLAEKLIRQLHQRMSIDGEAVATTVSIGAAIYPDHAADTEGLLQKADEAMYRSKNRGRDCWTLYASQPRPPSGIQARRLPSKTRARPGAIRSGSVPGGHRVRRGRQH